MAVKTFLHIGTSLKILEHVTILEVRQVINEHATLHLKAVINDDEKDNYARDNHAFEQILITRLEPGQEKPVPVFLGMIKKLCITCAGKVYYLEIEGVSNSYKTDIQVNSRSFQNKSTTYKEVVDTVIDPYPGGEVADTVSLGRAITVFTMQYLETDWAFLKRLASHFNVGLLPSIAYGEPKITFGIPAGKDCGDIEQYGYSIEKDIAGYAVSAANHNGNDLTELDKVTFRIQTSKDFDIGDQVTYQDIQLTIQSKETTLDKGVLFYTYALSTAKGLMQDLYYNEAITGVSLLGRVIGVVQDRVKVWLAIDWNREAPEAATAWEFPYTTPYTAQGNTGWYIMPEEEDLVYIHYPNKEEFNGIGMNAIRAHEKGGDKIDDPDIKYLRTKDGKELKFAPEEIVITCCNWSNKETGETNRIYIRLHESEGIEIQSTKPVNITSQSDVSFSGGDISFTAENSITLRCKTSQIKLDGAVDIAGQDVKIN